MFLDERQRGSGGQWERARPGVAELVLGLGHVASPLCLGVICEMGIR